MNCDIKPLKDRKRTIDTLPPRGKVNEVRKEWLMHEDGALAYRLQNEEFKQHLSGNKERNVQIREDFPCAKEEQTKEAIEAARVYQQWLQAQEEEDARVATELARKIEIEESQRRLRSEERDTALAKHLQEKEKEKLERKKYDRRDLEVHTPKKNELSSKRGNVAGSSALYDEDVAGSCVVDAHPRSRNGFYDSSLKEISNVGLSRHEDLIDSFSSCRVRQESRSVDRRFSSSPELVSEDEARKIQEEADAELARRLQEKEKGDPLDPLTRDHILAIEIQDKELARLLQEKEKARLRRARDRAKAKAAAKRAAELEEETSTNGHHADDTNEPILTHKPKPRYPDPDEILPAPDNSPSVDNVAMMIDPTYPRGSRRMTTDLDSELPDDAIAPPYMPIQGQRRFPDKKSKAHHSCKQQ